MTFSVLLERTLPLSKEIIDRIQSGELKIFGGTIRDAAGKIVKHLIFPPEGQKNKLDEIAQEINQNINQSHAEVMNQLASQTAILSAVNILSAQKTVDSLGKKLEEIGDKIDSLDQKAAMLLEAARFSKLIKVSEIRGKIVGAIEGLLYATLAEDDPKFLRLHMSPLRQGLVELEDLTNTLLKELNNKELIDNIHFVMLIADLKNKATFVLTQTHIRLEEDDIAQSYFLRNSESNALLRSRLEALKKTGAFTPHIISRESLDILKSDVGNFKQLELQSDILYSQNSLALKLKLPHKAFLNNSFHTTRMLDPIEVL